MNETRGRRGRVYCCVCKKPNLQKLTFNALFIGGDKRCDGCRGQLLPVTGDGCKTCGKKGGDMLCEGCKHWEERGMIVQNRSLYYYNDFAKTMVSSIKFMGDLR